MASFAWRNGYHYNGMDPDSVGAELERLTDEGGGRLVVETVIEAAREPASPLHAGFEWDDTKAAHEHRLAQARRLIRAVQVVISETKREPVFVSVTVTEAATGAYEPIRAALGDEAKLGAIIRSLQRRVAAAQADLDQALRMAAEAGIGIDQTLAASALAALAAANDAVARMH